MSFTAAEVALFLGTAIGKTLLGEEAADAEEEALERKKQQERLLAEQQGILREKQLQRVLSTQRAEGAARGIAPTSASLSAISRGTFDTFAEDEEARNMNLKIKEEAIDQKKENVRRAANWAIFGNLFDAANRHNNLSVSAPKGKPTGNELDLVATKPERFTVPGPLDFKMHNQEEINYNIGF